MTVSVQQHPLFTRDFIVDPYPVYAHLRDHEPVSKAPSPHGFDMWTLARYDDVKQSLVDPRLSRDLRLAPPGVIEYTGGSDQLTNKNLLSVDPPDHTRMRKLVQSAFTGRRVRELEGWVEDLVQRILDGMEGREQVDLVHAFGFALPLTVISHLMGIPVADRPNFRRWMDGLVMSGAGQAARDRLRESQRNLAAYCQDLIARKRSQPENDLVTALVQAVDEQDALSMEELIGVIFHLLIAGHETTVALLSTSALLLMCHPEQRAQLDADPTLWPTAVDEMMRFESPIGVSLAISTEDIEFSGTTIPKGEVVAGLLASANRDPRRFTDADRFDVTRTDNQHLGFGAGIHRCVGALLALTEARIALPALLTRFPDIQLAVPPQDLRWMPTPLFRQLQQLPVRLN
ncbi:cytochrome P450 family protein [Micromonospora sp. DT31]|uniref:cytochrome P450 family protein n=1 Tax=Micromonospora sp. DT31 TaxID=3393434 RepID=UPI003CF62046